MSIQEQFEASVKIIQNLPKDGPYQPSRDVMLMFYSFYKQATLGPCNLPKPSFWDVINRAKWSAWSDLGGMPSHEAMVRYVEEIKKIIEQMSLSSNLNEFMETIEAIFADEENKTSPGLRALVKPFTSLGLVEIPSEFLGTTQDDVEQLEVELDSSTNRSEQTPEESLDMLDDVSEDIFEDPMENPRHCAELHLELETCVRRLRDDFQNFEFKIKNLERHFAESRNHSKKAQSFIPLSELSSSTTFLLFAWPLVLHGILGAIRSLKKAKT